MPASQLSPCAAYGATPATDAAARQRPGSAAAQASACGPPPDQPTVTKVSASSSSRTAAVSAATSTTRRPGLGVDPSYPGLAAMMTRSPRMLAAWTVGG